MTAEHLLRQVLLLPFACGLGVALLLAWVGPARRPAWGGLAWTAALALALALGDTFAPALPPASAEEALPFAALAFGLCAALRLPGPAAGWGRLARDAAVLALPALAIAWLTAAPVRAYYGWSGPAFAGVLALAALAGGFSGALHRAMARLHPAPGAFAAWLVIGGGASAALLLGRSAKGMEFAAVACSTLAPLMALALWRGRARSAEALAAPFAGAMFAVLLHGMLQAELIWIAAALLALLAPAAGLLSLRSRSAWTLVGALVFVTALPAAAAVFMSFMRASVGAGPGGGG